jgi:hypothetical protein
VRAGVAKAAVASASRPDVAMLPLLLSAAVLMVSFTGMHCEGRSLSMLVLSLRAVLNPFSE